MKFCLSTASQWWAQERPFPRSPHGFAVNYRRAIGCSTFCFIWTHCISPAERRPNILVSLKKHNMQKWVTNLHELGKNILRRTTFNLTTGGEMFRCKETCYWIARQNKLQRFRITNVQNKKKKVLDWDNAAARVKFFMAAHNLRISVDERSVLYLGETWVIQNLSQKHTRQNIEKKMPENPSRKVAQSLCVPRRINKNRLHFGQQVGLSFTSTNARLRL
jgi:hypothetical protein